jgi:predicted MFS family arabinose efflux permease
MGNRWAVLALVAVARIAMGFQFQAVAVVGPFLVADLGLGYTELGMLIGLYLLPGAFLALPGGLLGARFGDRALVLGGLGLMTLGGAGLMASGTFGPAAASRLVAGAGGVLLNMQLAKIVTDWFAGRELATALGVMLATWPLGITLALATLGAVAAVTSWRVAIGATTVYAVIALALVLALYRDPGGPGAAPGPRRWWAISGQELGLTVVAGAAWATLNAGFIGFLAFGPRLLMERGASPAAAGLLVSWASFVSIGSVPLGGALLDRLPRRDAVVWAGLAGAGAASAAFVVGEPAWLWSVLVGLLVAPAAGVIALPGEVLRPATRSTGFGVFYTLYYVGMGLAPALAGYVVDRAGGAAAALWLAAGLWLLTLPALWTFRGLQRRWGRGDPSGPLALG